MAESAEIYALCEPDTGNIRYIGKANDSRKRLATHIRDSRRRDTPVYRWIRKLSTRGLLPVMRVLEVADDWREAERRLIAVSRARGDRLLNVAEGGDEPFCPPEVRAQNGKRLAEWIHSDPIRKRVWELKRAIGHLLREGFVSNANREKLRLAASKRPDLFGCYATLADRFPDESPKRWR